MGRGKRHQATFALGATAARPSPPALHLDDLVDPALLEQMIGAGMVRRQYHPDYDLVIYNYSQSAAWSRTWNEATLVCRGLITDGAGQVVARPFPKFFNHNQPEAPELDLDAPAVVTDKMDGSLGVLYPTPEGHAVATRGSFASEQAQRASSIWAERYAGTFEPEPHLTYLYEIVFPQNRVVVDYGDVEDLYLLAVLETATGKPASEPTDWPGPRTAELPYRTLAEALAAEPRPNCEGYVVYLPDSDERVKIKQADYLALHRILTGTNARHVWEQAAVEEFQHLIQDPKHWATYLGIDPARAAELLELGADWIKDVPDEFYGWVADVQRQSRERAAAIEQEGLALAAELKKIPDRRERFEAARQHRLQTEAMRLSADEPLGLEYDRLRMRAWRESAPDPEAPSAFQRSEDAD